MSAQDDTTATAETVELGDPIPWGRLVHELAVEDPERTAIVFAPREGPDEEISRRVLDRRSSQVARLLAERGAGPGKLVALALRNCPEHFYVAIGAWKAGAGVLPMRWDLPAWERDRLLDTAGAVLLVGEGDLSDSPIPWLTLEEVRSSTDLPDDPLPEIVAQPAIAIASSGSTGKPKIIVDPRPGETIPGAAEPMPAKYQELPPILSQIVPAPLYHTNGFTIAHGCILGGHPIVVMEKFEAAQAVDLIERHRVQCFSAVPTMLARMARVEGVRDRDLSSIEYVMQGGAAVPPWVVEAWIDLIGADRFYMSYGSSEKVGLALIRADQWLERRGSVGQGYKTEIRILDTEGNDLPAGEVGEIYMRQPEITVKTFEYVGAEPPKVTDDGFTSIGDLGWLDEDGYLYVADRRVDMIISGGANVFPAEVEAALSEHPAVHDVVVIGLPDPEWGRRVHAIVEPVAGVEPPTAAELNDHARERLTVYKVPKTYEFLEKMPRTDAGKINRSALTAEREEREAATPRS